jgi:hypothetical protein
MDNESLGILLAGISSVILAIVYLTKNIKESSCLGSKCSQDTSNNNHSVPVPAMPDPMLTFPQTIV